MESLSIFFSSSSSLINPSTKPLKFTPKSHLFLSNHSPKLISPQAQVSDTQDTNHLDISASRITLFPIKLHKGPFFINAQQYSLKTHLSFLSFGLSFPFSCLASETTVTEDVSNKINLESVLVSIDNFFNRYPFFVATVTFIWLVVIPLTEEYLQKYKYISAINAFKKLQNEPNCQLLDVRDSKSVSFLSSPNLKMLNKSVVQVEYREGDEDGFLKRVLENFGDPSNTILCIIDNFDGNSMKVAELLVKNNFKEAYAIRGGIIGQKGWQDIQEELLPPSVHVLPKKTTQKTSKPLETNGGVSQPVQDINVNSSSSSTPNSNASSINKEMINNGESKGVGPLSPYPNYPNFKPPSSPTPSKPK